MTKPRKLAVGIGFASLVCAAFGANSSAPFAWFWWWCALACALVSGAYAFNRPDVFGKRDGVVSPLHVLVLLPYWIAFWISCGLMRLSRGDEPWHEVAPGLYVGGRLRAEDLPPGVELIVDLAAEFSEPAELRGHPGYRCLPMLDGFHARDETAFCELLAEAATAQGGVLIHCESGRGRAPTAAALVLVARSVAEDPDTALELVRKGRPSAAPTRSDVQFIERIVARLGGR